MEMVVTTGAIRCAESSSQIITTNKRTSIFTVQTPFLSPNQKHWTKKCFEWYLLQKSQLKINAHVWEKSFKWVHAIKVYF